MTNISKGRYWDKPWSLVDGCTPCSPGCDHCWAAGMAHRFAREGEPGHTCGVLTDESGRFNGAVVPRPDRISIPLKRKPTVWAVWNDWCHEAVPHEFRGDMMDTVMCAPQHTYLFLTKRPTVALDFWRWLETKTTGDYREELLKYIYFGLTVCNQQEADEKIPVFLQVPGKKFLSIEPLLSEISLRWLRPSRGWYDNKLKTTGFVDEYDGLRLIDAVILGGETGPDARPMHPDWVRSVRGRCAEAGVPFFFKQWGKHRPGLKELFGNHYECRLKQMPDRYEIMNAGRLLDGRTHDDLPWTD